MDDDAELERLNRLLDDLAAERDPRDRAELSAAEVTLAQTAAWLKAASTRATPSAAFIDRLGAQLAAAAAPPPADALAPLEASPPSDVVAPVGDAPQPVAAPAAGLSRRGLLGRLATGAAGLAIGAGAGAALGTGLSAAAYERGQRDGERREMSEPFSTSLVPHDRGQGLDTGHTLAGLAPGQALRFHVGALEGFLVHPGDGRPLYALSAACTHMGCLLTWLQATGTFLCPCHGAQYHRDGTGRCAAGSRATPCRACARALTGRGGCSSGASAPIPPSRRSSPIRSHDAAGDATRAAGSAMAASA